MKIELLQHEFETVGWQMVAETEDDKITLAHIRNIQFFGMGETAVSYAGRTGNDYVESLKWQQNRFIEDGLKKDLPKLIVKKS